MKHQYLPIANDFGGTKKFSFAPAECSGDVKKFLFALAEHSVSMN